MVLYEWPEDTIITSEENGIFPLTCMIRCSSTVQETGRQLESILSAPMGFVAVVILVLGVLVMCATAGLSWIVSWYPM